jgi:hypothetical protein
MADVFTVKIVQTNGSLTTHQTACKTYLDTLLAAKIDAINYIRTGTSHVTQVVSHA